MKVDVLMSLLDIFQKQLNVHLEDTKKLKKSIFQRNVE